MFRRPLQYSIAIFALCVLFLSACGSKPVLISKSAAIPLGIDLTGSWLVREDPGAARLADNARIRDGLVLTGRSSRSRRERKNTDGSVQVFLEFGEVLKITQTVSGLFISYDRSVVEEYRFGENRLATVGPIEAVRVSGWESQAFVVETLDETGTILFETWRLREGNNILERDIQIKKGELEVFSRMQVFDRQ